ncbi:unnamed protein product [Caretta caretta]
MEWLQNPDRRWPPTVDHRCRRQARQVLFSNFSAGCLEQGTRDFSLYRPCENQRRIFYFPPNQKNPRDPCPCWPLLSGTWSSLERQRVKESPCLGRFHPASPVSGSS